VLLLGSRLGGFEIDDSGGGGGGGAVRGRDAATTLGDPGLEALQFPVPDGRSRMVLPTVFLRLVLVAVLAE
jgi:hypothetical protein